MPRPWALPDVAETPQVVPARLGLVGRPVVRAIQAATLRPVQLPSSAGGVCSAWAKACCWSGARRGARPGCWGRRSVSPAAPRCV